MAQVAEAEDVSFLMRSPAQTGAPTDERTDRHLLGVCLLVVASHVVDGPLRFALGAFGLASLLYLRDLLALYVVARSLSIWMSGQRRGLELVAVLWILAWHFMIGMLVLHSVYQPALGLKVFDGFLMGFCVGPVAIRDPRLARVAIAVLGVTALGVIANSFVAYPWVGAAFDTAFGEVAGSREWSTNGVQRLPGFARASYDASIMMLLAGATVLPERRIGLLKLVLCVCGMYAVYLTTTKAAATAVAALAVWYVLQVWLNWRWAVVVELWSLFALCVALPALSVFGSTFSRVDFPAWMDSFVDRIVNTWPSAYQTIAHEGTWLSGRGLGGIGFPQYVLNTVDRNPADNLVVYIVSAFGVLGLLYLLGWLIGLSRRSVAQHPVLHGWTLVLLACGLTTNMIENSVMSIAIGLAFGFVLQPPRRTS